MNVLHINDKLEIIGGVEVYISQLMELQPDVSMQPFWISIQSTDKTYSITLYPDLKEFHYASVKKLSQGLQQLAEKLNIDVIHVHSISKPDIIEACFATAPVVRTMHEPRMICPGQGKFWRKTERICDQPFGLHCLYHIYAEGCSNRHPARVAAAMYNSYYEINQASARYKSILVSSRYLLHESRLTSMDESVLKLLPMFTPYVEPGELRNSQYNEVKRINFTGRFSVSKGVQYFIEAALKILEHKTDVIFDLVGDGDKKDEYEGMIPESRKDYFKFHGWQPINEANKILSDSYCLIFPSIYPEAFGITGIEAMMRGKPVCAFDVGGVDSWLKNNITGYLVPPKNTDKLAEKTLQLLDNEHLYRNMSENARKIAVEEFAPKTHLSRLKQIYRQALETNKNT